MLTIEKKKTDKVDWIKPLQKYISTQYNDQSSAEHTEALNSLNSLREDCRNSNDKSDAVKDIWLRYYYTLSQVEIRFPISEDNVHITFPWYNSFGGKKISLYSVYYERACALFNYAVLLSQLGAMQNRNSADGVKLAAGYFQGAAGAFTELREYVGRHPECSKSDDLSSECLSMLVALHLGQAQNCFVEKAVKDGMKDAIIAKLTAQAAEYYETANTLLNGPLKSMDRTFASHIEIWALIHKASYHYRLANFVAESMKYGEQVARLIVADNILTETKKKVSRYTPPELKEHLEKTAAIINKARFSAEKDNNVIYNAIVVPENKLEAPEKKPLVKAAPVPEQPSITDWFSKLVPFAIKEAAGRYRDMKDEQVRKDLVTLDDYNEIAKVSLSSLNLPGAIEALETPTGIPPALASKMETIKSENGPTLIVDLMETLRNLSDEDNSMLNKALDMLNKEEEEDNKLRTTHAAKWSRTPSHTLTPALRQEAAKYKGHIEHATKSDAFVASKWRDHEASVSLLAGPPNPVITLLGAGGPTTSTADTRPLKKVLAELDGLIAAREALKSELQAISSKDDVALKLLNAPGMSHDQVFGEELRKYDPIQTKLRENYVKQENLLQVLTEEHAKFMSVRNADTAAQSAREQKEHTLTKLAEAFKVYNEVKAGLREGINFYTNLQDLLKSFTSKCSDFIMARDTEKTDLIQQIQHQQQQQQQQQHQQQMQHQTVQHPPPPYQAPPQYPGQPVHYQAPNIQQTNAPSAPTAPPHSAPGGPSSSQAPLSPPPYPYPNDSAPPASQTVTQFPWQVAAPPLYGSFSPAPPAYYGVPPPQAAPPPYYAAPGTGYPPPYGYQPQPPYKR